MSFDEREHLDNLQRRVHEQRREIAGLRRAHTRLRYMCQELLKAYSEATKEFDHPMHDRIEMTTLCEWAHSELYGAEGWPGWERWPVPPPPKEERP